MGLLGQMSVKFSGDVSGLQSAAGAAKGILSNLGSGNFAGAAVGTLTALAGAAIGVGVASTKMAGNFEAGLTSLVTGAGEARSNIQMVGDGIKSLAVSTATSTKQLTDGMYMIESSGYHGAQGLQVLQVAAQGAKVGNADLGTTANALTTILTDYHMSATQSASAMNGLTATVQSGKTNLQSLGGAMGSILPLASSLHVSFPQVAGAIATMTNSGMNAQRASSNLANAVRNLAAPGGAATKSLKEVGLSAQQLKDTLTNQGLAQAIQLVETHVGKTFPAGSVDAVNAFKKIMGGATGYNVALMLGGKNMSTFTGNVQNVANAMKSGSGAVTGWSDVQKTFNFKMDQAKQSLNVLMITLGQQLLPVIGQIVGATTPVITQFTTWIAKSGILPTALNLVIGGVKLLSSILLGLINGIGQVVSFFQKNQAAALALLPVIGMLGGYFVSLAVSAVASFIAAAPAMIAGFISGAAAAWTMAAGVIAATWPFLLIGAAIGLVIVIVVLLVQHWGQVVSFMQGTWSRFTGWMVGALNNIKNFFIMIWNGILNFLKMVGLAILAVIIGPIGLLIIYVITHFTQVKAFITAVFFAVLAIVTNVWNNIKSSVMNAVTGLWNIINNFFGGLPAKMLNFGVNMIQGLINGILSMAGAIGNAIGGMFSGLGSTVHNALHGAGIPGFASGVNNFNAGPSNGWAIVGEQGPELVKLPGGSNVYPNGKGPSGGSRGSSTSGGGSQTIVIELDGHTLTQVVSDRQARNVRLKMGRRS